MRRARWGGSGFGEPQAAPVDGGMARRVHRGHEGGVAAAVAGERVAGCAWTRRERRRVRWAEGREK